MITVAIIQARLGSTRLPGKSLMPLCGKPLVQHVVDRVREVKELDRVMLAVPRSDAVAFQAHTNAEVCAPDVPEDDVLGRYVAVANDLGLEDTDWVLRVTGDCPLWEPAVGTELLSTREPVGEYKQTTWASADTTCSGWPDGCDAELFPVWMLREAERAVIWPADREHVTRLMRRTYPYKIIAAREDRGWLKLSVNTAEDFERARVILEAGA